MKNIIQSVLHTVLILGASISIAHAAPLEFDFKDPKGVNNVRFNLDAPLESISGTGTGISGTVTFDLDAPEKTTGKIVLETKSLTVGNPMMSEHLQSAHWLDTETYPQIVFEVVKVEDVKRDGNNIHANVTGNLTVKDVTKEITVPVRFTHLEGRLGSRLNDATLKGDLLVIRTDFTINRSDYNIQPGNHADKVAETIELSLSIAGAAFTK